MGAVPGLHLRDRRHHRNGRLTDRNDMDRRRPRHVEEIADFDDVVDVVVEIEMSDRERNHASVHPVGDIDVMGRQEGFDRAAQQGRIMARHGRDDQQARLARRMGGQVTPEMQELAERPDPDDFLFDRDLLAADHGLFEAEGRLAVTAGHALEQFRRSREIAAHRRIGQRIERALEGQPGHVGKRARRRHRQMDHLVEMIGVLVHCLAPRRNRQRPPAGSHKKPGQSRAVTGKFT